MKNVITAIALLTLSGLASAQDGYSAKSLFFGDDGTVKTAATAKTAPAAPNVALQAKNDTKGKQKKTLIAKQIGASYFIRLKRDDGSTRDVLANTTFRSGDRFQLGVKVNRPSYVYVLNQDPDGNVSQIFPVAGQDNYVNAMGTVFLPARGAFEFDAKPGAEHLLVFLSPTPMREGIQDLAGRSQPDLVSDTGSTCAPAGQLASNQLAGNGAGGDTLFASKGIAFKEDDASRCGAPPAFASKAIVFSDDPRPEQGGQVASYVVKKLDSSKTDKNLFLKIKLAHE